MTSLGLTQWIFLFIAERARPYLMTFDSSDSSDFINAVYVNVSSQLYKTETVNNDVGSNS